jgi:membrane associated rhomboid family serine protease
MGLYDRDYTQSDFQSEHRYAPRMRIGLPQLTPVVKAMIAANVVIFFAGIMIFRKGTLVDTPAGPIPVSDLDRWFSVFPYSLGAILQVWRLITYQFLHGNIMHILFNMLGLFFLGPTLEQHWGSKRFLIFYLSCGVAGALFYILLVAVGSLQPLPMIGASGAILGMLAACAILFPHFVVFLIVFPVPIRTAAVILTLVYLARLITVAQNAGGDAAHLAGMAAGAVYVISQRWREALRYKFAARLRRSKAATQRSLQDELDEILEKVHRAGIHSLTRREKKILKQATEAEQKRDIS